MVEEEEVEIVIEEEAVSGSKLLLDWVKDGSLPLMGASPDGMLR